jgi:peptide/nickel transport system substrate-binding protein
MNRNSFLPYPRQRQPQFLVSCCLFSLLICPTISCGQSDERPDRTTLPILEDMQLPSAASLMENDAFDWVVLKNDQTVIVAEPLYPRPDTLEKRDEERRRLAAIRRRTEAERKRLQELTFLTLNLAGDTLTDYRIPAASVERIILHEELMLQRTDQLLDSGDIRQAYDLLLFVDQSLPNWGPAVPRFERLLLTEAKQRSEVGDTYAALALLDELAARNIDNADLPIRIGELSTPLIDEAIQATDYGKARYLIGRIESHFPQHPVAKEYRARIESLASDKLKEAQALADKGQHDAAAALARESASIWPPAGNARTMYTRLVSRHQVLRAGVDSLAGPETVFPIPLDSVTRERELTEVPLFEPYSADELTYFRSSFFEKWDPSDLGREVIFTLRETRPYWQSQPILTANQMADAIARRLDLQDPLFDPRLASFVSEFSVRSPTELRLRFSRVPLSIEALFRFPVVVDAAGDSADAAGETAAGGLLSTRLRLTATDETSRSYRRIIPEPDGLDSVQYHVAEVVERRFSDRHKMLQAMIRGDLEYIPELKPWEIDAFRAASRFQTVQYAIPNTHVIVFNPLSESNTSAQLRRCMSFAIDRSGILANVVLRDSRMKHGRLSSATWHQRSYATNRVEEAPVYDIRLAYALRFAAERQLQIAELKKLEKVARLENKERMRQLTTAWRKAKAEAEANGQKPPEAPATEKFEGEKFRAETDVSYIKLPTLRMVVEPDDTALPAAEKIVAYWKKITLDVEIIPGDRPGQPLADDEWDVMYRRVKMDEPLLDLWPVLTSDTSFDITRLNQFPDWMRQEVIGLDYAGSFIEAQDRLFTIHKHIAAQSFIIPLWEVDDYAVFQNTVGGFSDRPLSEYQNVERWTIRP